VRYRGGIMAAFVLGIDQGTTGTRACAMAADGTVLAAAYRAHRQLFPRPGWVEHDAEEIWTNARAAIADVLAAIEGTPAALGIANQGETVMLWDRADARPLHHALVWQDVRTQPWMESLARDAAVADGVRERTGLRLDAYFSAGKLRWLLDHVPDARALAAAGRLRAGTLDSWLLARLTDGAAFVTDASTAARTLLFDIHSGAWDPWLLGLFGVPAGILPEVRATVGDFGHVAACGPRLDGVPIVASLVDQPAAMVGQGCLDTGSVKATFGTGCFVYMNSGDDARPSRHGLLRTVAWRRDGRPTYALDGGIFAAGSVATWLRHDLGLADSEAALDALAASVPDTAGAVCVPALAGLAAPYWRREARAAWLGLGLGTTRAHLVRAALEGVACRVVQVVRAMEEDAGGAIAALRVDGGLTHCTTLMQLQADLGGVPVAISAEPEATVMGVCYLAARALGWWSSDDEIRRRARTARVYEPRMDAATRGARLESFTRAAHLIQQWSA
jgi:glycerol kinase